MLKIERKCVQILFPISGTMTILEFISSTFQYIPNFLYRGYGIFVKEEPVKFKTHF